MMKRVVRILLMALLLLHTNIVDAQKFFNLTAEEVKIDSTLPRFTYSVPLPQNCHDSVYTAQILYPEFIDMTTKDVAAYHALSVEALPALPRVGQRIVSERGKKTLVCSLSPLVYRNGKYQLLVSFMLDIKSKPLARSRQKQMAKTRAANAADRYAAHSVLADGSWAKIRVKQTGVYQLTNELIRKAGFNDLAHVKVYGYGGYLQNEALDADELRRTDDLKEVPLCIVDGKRLFYAKGSVSWSSSNALRRTRNPYSDYGYYFITQSKEEPLTVDSSEFISSFYPSADDYHEIYEVDKFSWFNGGRNLFDGETISEGATRDYIFTNRAKAEKARLSVNATSNVVTEFEVLLNGKVIGTQRTPRLGTYDKASASSKVYDVDGLQSADTVSIHVLSGGTLRLDYISFAYSAPCEAPVLKGLQAKVPEYVYNITNQDHHADVQADMVIIIPTSQKLLKQAQRLKAFHETHDSLSVNIVPADELYNEFSSGTPDANAYRRYLKMLYDRANSADEMPKYLLLFGDCSFDNRMLTSPMRNENTDDYLLCFESENSFNAVNCYVDDCWFALLDDGEGTNPQTNDLLDVAVGRFPVLTADEAKVMVDKTIDYVTNNNAGDWQNTCLFMGDDGNDNLHMKDADDAANDVMARHPEMNVKKLMWDAYKIVTASDGNSYPEVTKLIRQQQQKGALIMDYAGHGRPDQLSHEKILFLNDFKNFSNKNLPLWITASCDIMPFDAPEENIGEAAVLNANGGALAFFGTTRTVYADKNRLINMAYLRYVLGESNGKRNTIGEAQRLAKNYLTTSGADISNNKLQYSLLGDPAIALNMPVEKIVIDSINGMAVGDNSSYAQLKAGSIVRVSGHIHGHEDFNGVVSATVHDAEEQITCLFNQENEADEPFIFKDRTKNLYSGSNVVKNGKFSFSFAVPKDISYSNGNGLINVYAVNDEKTVTANGYNEDFIVGGDAVADNDSIGPSVYCYLNSPSFVDGGNVNKTPYFVAQISDKDGINTTGNGIGHDLQLVIDNQTSQTYILNNNFTYDFGSYTSGSTYYSLPELSVGTHKLQFRAWDIYNNSSTTTLTFNVVEGLAPRFFDVNCTHNPATTTTTFVITHDRMGSNMNVELEVFDMSGRILWKHSENGVSADNAYSVNWDLTMNGGSKLQTGVYLYRARISSDGSSKASKAKKLIVIQ